MQQLAKYLVATGRGLRILGNVISHFFRKGKLGLPELATAHFSDTSSL